ncbi:hypothetical protein Bbelb_244280 [Branchiostoma belcheri]|nr:hypothetical protein Bbelb_244280 [Branchiostoma belcheri]
MLKVTQQIGIVLALLAACDGLEPACFPGCNSTESWPSCVSSRTSYYGAYESHKAQLLDAACILCTKQQQGMLGPVQTASQRNSTCLPKHEHVAVKGFPFGVLSKLRPRHQAMEWLALVECGITDLEESALSVFPVLTLLNLDSNNLTHVKQKWFDGLPMLNTLTLAHNYITRHAANLTHFCTHAWEDISSVKLALGEHVTLQIVEIGLTEIGLRQYNEPHIVAVVLSDVTAMENKGASSPNKNASVSGHEEVMNVTCFINTWRTTYRHVFPSPVSSGPDDSVCTERKRGEENATLTTYVYTPGTRTTAGMLFKRQPSRIGPCWRGLSQPLDDQRTRYVDLITVHKPNDEYGRGNTQSSSPDYPSIYNNETITSARTDYQTVNNDETEEAVDAASLPIYGNESEGAVSDSQPIYGNENEGTVSTDSQPIYE